MAKKHPLFGTRVTPDSGWFYGLWELIRLERQVFRTCFHKARVYAWKDRFLIYRAQDRLMEYLLVSLDDDGQQNADHNDVKGELSHVLDQTG